MVRVKIPANGLSNLDYCSKLLAETGVSTTPGSVIGKFDEGYLRISLCMTTHRIQDAMERFIIWAKKQG